MPFISNTWAEPLTLPAKGPLRDTWMAINFYHPKADSFTTEIANPDFFISPEGSTSPSQEFDDFIQAVQKYQQDRSQTEILCKFPARTTLMRTYVTAFKDLPEPNCKDYPRYVDPTKVTGISIIFASGYFESPASYFGHTMIKFETSQKDVNEFFFDSSLNYGAQITNSTMNPMYIVNGLTGGYTASFQRNNEFIHTNNYTNKEMRDVWEYPLDFTAEQRTFLVEFSSELRRAKFKYYFFNDNCAHRMARLVEIALGRKLVDTDGPWLLPIQVIQALSQPEDGPSPLKAEIRTPSLKSRTRLNYLSLPQADQAMVKSYLKNSLEDQKSSISGVSDGALEVVRGQYDIELAKLSTKPKDAEKAKELQAHRQITLQERLKRPANANPTPRQEQGNKLSPAHLKHPGALQLAYIVRPGSDALNIRAQAANNDLLTASLEGQEASRFIMGAIEADITKGEIDLKSATFIDIASLNTNPLSTGWLNELSWSIKAEYAPRNNICDKCSTINVDAKMGKAVRLSPDVMVYGLLGGQVNHKRTDLNDIVMFTSENGALININDKTRLNAGIKAEVSTESVNPAYLAHSTLVYDVQPQMDLRLGVENDFEDSAIMARISWYF